MARTILEHGLLTTRIDERDMCVCTAVGEKARRPPSGRPWTSVLAGQGPHTAVVWLRFYQGPTTPGGLEEAHHSVVAQLRAHTLPGLDVPDDEADASWTQA